MAPDEERPLFKDWVRPDLRKRVTILITSIGHRVALAQSFRNAGVALDIDLNIITCDLNPKDSPGCLVADAAYEVPSPSADNYIAALMEIAVTHSVDLIIPASDAELQVLSCNTAVFANIGARIAISDPDLITIALDRLETAAFLSKHGFETPHIAEIRLDPPAMHDWSWPILASSRHYGPDHFSQIAKSPDDLDGLPANEGLVAQEVLDGRHFVVIMFFDQTSQLRTVIPYERIGRQLGTVQNGVTCRHEGLNEVAERLAQVLPGPKSAVSFQAIITPDEKISIFKLNARFGSGYLLANHAGAKFAQWLVEEVLYGQCSANNEWQDDVTMLRYDAAVFLGG
jgi:carbamoyl-phosphate synthase large subunit